MLLEADSSLTVGEKQKFTIREMSPEWGFTTEFTKVGTMSPMFSVLLPKILYASLSRAIVFSRFYILLLMDL